MGVVAVLAALTVTAFSSARNQSVASDATEQLLSAIREAQNRSISITKGKSTNPVTEDTKAWGVKMNTNAAWLVYFDAQSVPPSTSNVVMRTQESLPLYPGVSLRMTHYDKSTNITYSDVSRYIVYSTPFAGPYTMTDTPATCLTTWAEASVPTKEWRPASANCPDSWESGQNEDYIEIRVSYKGQYQTIKINSKNEAYIK